MTYHFLHVFLTEHDIYYVILTGVRLDRVRGGRQKYKRNIDSNSLIQPILPMIKKACYECETFPIHECKFNILNNTLHVWEELL